MFQIPWQHKATLARKSCNEACFETSTVPQTERLVTNQKGDLIL